MSQTRTNTPRFAPLALAGMVGVAAAAAGGLGGCASSQSYDSNAMTGDQMVVSGTPSTDTAAFRASSSRLDRARFDQQEKQAPKPTLLADSISGGADAPMVGPSDSGDVIGADGNPVPMTIASATSRPAPTTRPMAMPHSRVHLPDGRIRFIWDMQGFGGGKVTSTGAGTARRAITITAGDLNPLITLVQTHLGEGGTVVPLIAENKLVIVCASDHEESVLGLLRDIDRPTQQVEITAKIFEVSHDFDFQQGANLLLQRIAADGTQSALSTFNTQKLLDAAAGGSPFQGSIVSLMQVLEDSGIGIDASFELLAETGLINVVSEPRITVAEGETGYMLAGQELPIQSATITNNVFSAATTYKPVGVQLYVTPQTISAGHVKLHTVSVVSSVAGFTPLPTLRDNGTNQSRMPLLLNPILESREAETNVTVNTGETLVISGMRMVRTTTREDKVPGLGDLPILGHLFKSHRTQRRMTDLYFFLTPTLVDAGPMAMIE